MDHPNIGAAGLVLTFIGGGMELIRPALPRWNIKIPAMLDTILGFGGLVCIAIGLYLAWGLLAQYVRFGPAIGALSESPWPSAVVFSVLIVSIVWAVIKLPPTFAPPTGPTPPQNEFNFLSGLKMLSFFECVGPNLDGRSPIRVVTVPKYREYSEMIVKVLRLAGNEVIANQNDSSYLFPATTECEGVTIRNRPKRNLGVGFGLMAAFVQIDIIPNVKELPDTDAFNYVQIEIGGSA